MKRLYYLTQNIESTESISNDLHSAGITDWNFHVVCKNESGIVKRQIHSANALQKTDLIHSAERGLLRGLVAGVIMAFLLSLVEVHGRELTMQILLGVLVLAVIFGIYHGVLFGYQNENFKLKPFHDKIEDGFYLIMVDTPASDKRRVIHLMQEKHPEAKLVSEDTTLVWPFGNAKPTAF